MSLDDHVDKVEEHLARGNKALQRARLIGAGLTVFVVAHLELIGVHAMRTLGLPEGFFAIVYPLLLGGFILAVLLPRRGHS